MSLTLAAAQRAGAQRRMPALLVVEQLDVVEQLCPGQGVRLEAIAEFGGHGRELRPFLLAATAQAVPPPAAGPGGALCRSSGLINLLSCDAQGLISVVADRAALQDRCRGPGRTISATSR